MSNFKNLKMLSLFALLITGGCQNYLDRHDGVTTFAGDAQAANEIKMVVDPWNPNAENTHIDTDGKRASDAIVRYRNANEGKSEEVGGGSQTQ